MTLAVAAVVVLLLAGLACGLFLSNFPAFEAGLREPVDQSVDPSKLAKVSVLIPARDEAASIQACVESILANERVEVEVVVLDDQSTDRTAEIVNQISKSDERVRLEHGDPLPDGWNGKQHACWRLSQLARFDTLVFLDADVRLEPTALANLMAYQDKHQVALLSAFPHQQTETWLEQWIIPLMHYILLCYLPMHLMRASTSPGFASGCGQLFLTQRKNYELAGTHQAIASSRHDGIKLPRAYRLAGLSTDVLDGSTIATCRMYHSAPEVIRGVLKNADEGIANAQRIIPFTILLAGGSIAPLVITLAAAAGGNWVWMMLGIVAVIAGHAPRAIAASRFRQPWAGVFFHAPAVAGFLVLQWTALAFHWLGYRLSWRGRN